MNYIDEIFNRCSIDKICDFLLYGSEMLENNTESYYSRSKNAYEKLNEWLKAQFPDINEQNEQGAYVYSFACEIEKIHFQLGLHAGIMLATEIHKKHQTETHVSHEI